MTNLKETDPEYKRLQKISKAMNVPMKELLEQYEENYADLVEKKTEGNIARLAVNTIVNARRRKEDKQSFTPKAKAELVSGFIIGETGEMDKAEIIRKTAKRYVKQEGRQAAIDAQLIDGDNRVLDTREKIYGRANPEYLNPLPESLALRKRALFGAWRRNGDTKFKFGVLRTEDNKLARAWGKAKTFRPCTTFGIIKEDSTEILMNSSSAENTQSVFKALKEDWDILGILEDIFKDKFTDLSGVEKHYETFKDAWDRHIVVRGMVAWINLDRPTPWGAVYACLIDPDLGYEADQRVRILIPEFIKVDFGEGSEIMVLGKTKRTKYRDDDDKLVDGDVIINVWGIYPIPGLTTDLGEPKPEIDDAEIEGWFE